MRPKPIKVHQAKLNQATGGSPIYGHIPVVEIAEYGNNAKASRKVWLLLTPDAISELRQALGAAVTQYEEAAAFARKSLTG